MQSEQWTVQVYISGDEDDTVARAVLLTSQGMRVIGVGRARRNPVDRPVPEIGDELAVGRALADLADRLRGVAAADIAQLSGPT